MKTLGDLGEKEVVRLLLTRIESSVAVGPGDDAAAVDMGDKYLVITTDLITKRGHVPMSMTDWQTGWMAAAVNYSDLAAMGAKPLGMVVAFGLPRSTELDSLREIMRGIQDCSLSVGGEVLGGDTKEAGEMLIAGTALGTVPKGDILLRKGARPGDLLAVTGSMGLAAAGYRALELGLEYPRAIKALFEPQPRVREGMVLSSSGVVTSCMDITDGLAFSVHQISEAGGISFEVVWDSVPVDEEVRAIARRSGDSIEDLVLYYGGDYQLLFTLRPEGLERLRSLLEGSFSVIGRVRDRGENVLIKDDHVIALVNRGYEHFKR